jgi:hypothetical protein
MKNWTVITQLISEIQVMNFNRELDARCWILDDRYWMPDATSCEDRVAGCEDG